MTSLDVSAEAKEFALLIGVSDYNTSPLAGPLNDVVAVKGALQLFLGYSSDRVVSLTNGQATKTRILQELDRLSSELSGDDTLFLYFLSLIHI